MVRGSTLLVLTEVCDCLQGTPSSHVLEDPLSRGFYLSSVSLTSVAGGQGAVCVCEVVDSDE